LRVLQNLWEPATALGIHDSSRQQRSKTRRAEKKPAMRPVFFS
jgi:hypothetical protein